MKEEIFKVQSISQLCDLCGFEKPSHPLIYIVDVSKWEIGQEQVGLRYSSDFYTIAMKDSNCGMQYGRHYYDFNEGVMIFTAPDQVTSTDKSQRLNEIQGFMIFFHRDLIRNTHLGEIIDQYSFFSYDTHEALHLSEKEQQTINGLVDNIRSEISERIDNHSNTVIVSGIELLLNYCMRFYDRQFNTRRAQNTDVLSTVNKCLKEYYQSNLPTDQGVASVQYLADKVHLSAHYLSDLLKKETGRSALDHINDFVIEKAKTNLLQSQDSISEIAYDLGFNYPHYFSRLFKQKTGISPVEYRKLN